MGIDLRRSMPWMVFNFALVLVGRFMTKQKTAKSLKILGAAIHCPICQHDKFWSRESLLNTRAASFFDFDWANKAATNHVCDQCGHILWFLTK